MSMADRDGVIWMDGELVPWREAKIHVLTHTLHYGMGVFEGVRAYKTGQGAAIFRLQEHVRRLLGSAHIMKMSVPYSQEELIEVHKTVVRENGLETAWRPGSGVLTWVRRIWRRVSASRPHHLPVTM